MSTELFHTALAMPETVTFRNISLAELSVGGAIKALADLGEADRANELALMVSASEGRLSLATPLRSLSALKPYEYPGVSVGYIGTDNSIVEARDAEPEIGLKNTSINIKLDGIYAKDYPGKGESSVLIKCSGVHHLPNAADLAVAFTREFTVRDERGGGGDAGIQGIPFFMGLSVPPGGVGLSFELVYLKDISASRYLDFLNSGPVKTGLSLAGAANPAIAQFSELASGLVSYFVKRNEGRRIHGGYVGFDFGGRTGAKLRQGSYVIAQTPNQAEFARSRWHFKNGEISDDSNNRFPYNYLVIRAEAYEAPPASPNPSAGLVGVNGSSSD